MFSLNVRFHDFRHHARAAVKLFVLAGVISIGHALYESRTRYDQMAFGTYFTWWSQFNHGLNPWRLGCNYTPFFIVAFAPLANLDQRLAYWIWQALQVTALLVVLALAFSQLRRDVETKFVISLGTVVLLFPHLVYGTLYEAEPTLMLLALLLASWVLANQGRAALAGLMVALAALLKVYPAAAGGYFLFRRRFDVIVWSLVFSLLGLLLSGPTLWLESLFSGALPYFHTPDWARDERSLSFLLKAFSAADALRLPPAQQPYWILAAYLLLSLGAILLAALATPIRPASVELDGICFSLWLIIALFVSPITWSNEITFTLPLYVFVPAYLSQCCHLLRSLETLLFSIATLGFIISYYSTPVRSLHVYFIALLVEYTAVILILRHSYSRRADTADSVVQNRART